MLTILLVSSALSAPMAVAASAPASGPAFELAVGQGIRDNFERLGGYEVEYTRTRETLVIREELPNGETHIRQAPQPIPGQGGVRTCVWKEDPATVSSSYREQIPHRPARQLMYDGDQDKYYSRFSPVDVLEESVFPRGPIREGEDGRWDKLHNRDRKRMHDGTLHPLDLVFPRSEGMSGHCPPYLGPYPVLGKSGQFTTISATRFVRSADEAVEVRGIETVQFDREGGLWGRKDTAKFVPFETLGKDDWVFRNKRLLDRWWLDPGHGYLPVRVEANAPGDGVLLFATDVLKYKEVAPKTWFPVLGTITGFTALGKESDYKINRLQGVVPSYRITIEVTKVSIGKSFGKDEFRPGPNDRVRQEKPKPPSGE